jgi:hypothetical protein
VGPVTADGTRAARRGKDGGRWRPGAAGHRGRLGRPADCPARPSSLPDLVTRGRSRARGGLVYGVRSACVAGHPARRTWSTHSLLLGGCRYSPGRSPCLPCTGETARGRVGSGLEERGHPTPERHGAWRYARRPPVALAERARKRPTSTLLRRFRQRRTARQRRNRRPMSRPLAEHPARHCSVSPTAAFSPRRSRTPTARST